MSLIATTPYESECPPAFQTVLDRLATRQVNVKELWRYAMVLLLVDEEKARFTDWHLDGETMHLFGQTNAGERFSVVRPPMSEEVEQILLEEIRLAEKEGQTGYIP